MSKSVSEIRFAVVMYGGLSLAIYINGVAQELLRMVRATDKVSGFDSTETIYHKIACLLGNAEKLEEIKKAQTSDAIKKILDDIKPEDCSPTKFVVDILSGTSAGGINAVFLAKALTNNQDIDQLQQLWLNEGEISKLINDKKSVADTNLKNPETVKSLFNSQRMYLKLLDALEGMEEKSGTSIVKQLDLFVTVTDLAGVSIPLRLSDKVVEEKRYKQSLHFRFENGFNDFMRKNNPMLAFAARCTSSFPFAFEPMRLSAAREVISSSYADAAEKYKNLAADIKRLFPLTTDALGKEIEWNKRDLVDGGVLDNKPFGHAINAISNRNAEINVRRKLIYVEPSPELLNFEQQAAGSPNAILNLKACAFDLPTYETIREDLERVLDRNRLIDRVNHFINSAEQDVFNYRLNIEPEILKTKKVSNFTSDETTNLPENGIDWEKQGLEDVVQWKGNAALPYYRLRIATLTDDLARIVARKIGISEDGENFRVIRALVQAWRKQNFGNYRKENSPVDGREKTVLYFLREFDINYRLRRLRFVLNKADQLYRFPENFQNELQKRQRQLSEISDNMPEKYEPDSIQQSNLSVQSYTEETIKQFNTSKKLKGGSIKTPSEIIWEKCVKNADQKTENIKKMRLIIDSVMGELNEVSETIRKERDYLFQRKPEFEEIAEKSDRNLDRSVFEEKIKDIKLEPADLKKIVGVIGFSDDEDGIDEVSETKLLNFLTSEYSQMLKDVDSAATILSIVLNKVFENSREAVAKNLMFNEIFDPADKDKDVDLINGVRGYLYYFYKNFDDLSDQISLPIFYETPVGEAVPIEVLRISPRDAKGLIDEENPNLKRKKLAGTQFFNFGAFFDQVWRKNDIMWGRLDGAERLITALLSDEKLEMVRTYFVQEAHEIILREELLKNNSDELQKVFGESLLKSSAGINIEKAVGSITDKLGSEALNKRLTEILGSCIKDENVYKYVKDSYEVDRRLEPKPMLQVISRSTKVTGDILDDIAKDQGMSGDQLRWITRLGQIFWGLVEVAAPNSFWNLLFHNWLNLIYFFEVILIVTSTFLVNEAIQKFGVIGLVFTLLTHMTVLTLTDVMKGGKNLKLARYFGVGIMAILAFLGLVFVISFFFYDSFWTRINFWQFNWAKIPASQRMLAAFPVTILTLYLIWQKSDKPERPEVKKVLVVFLAAFIATGALITWFASGAKTETNTQPMLNMEFASKPEEVPIYAGKFDSPERRGINRALAVDSYLLVPIYAGFLFYLAQLFRFRRENWAKYIRLFTSLLIIMAALADLAENYFMFSLLQLKTNEINQWLLNAVRISTITKWSTVFASIIVLIIGGLAYWFTKDSKDRN